MFLCSVKGRNLLATFFSPYGCRRLVTYLLPESLSFGAGWTCQPTRPLAKNDALAVLPGQFGKPRWRPRDWCLSQRRARLNYVLSRKTLSSRLSEWQGNTRQCCSSFFVAFFNDKMFPGWCSTIQSWITELEGTLEFMVILISQRNQLKRTKILHPRPHGWLCGKIENRTQVFLSLSYSFFFSACIYNALVLSKEKFCTGKMFFDWLLCSRDPICFFCTHVVL